jgi:hypothetical protein
MNGFGPSEETDDYLGDHAMPAQHCNLPSEMELVSIIEKLKSRESDFTTPKSRMIFLNKLYKYQKMLHATRDGQPERWREYTAVLI